MRAYQKRVIFLKNTGSESFEEAYFVISERGGERKSSLDMVGEAKRIIKESFGVGRRIPRVLRPSFLLPFSLGSVTAAVILLSVYFVNL